MDSNQQIIVDDRMRDLQQAAADDRIVRQSHDAEASSGHRPPGRIRLAVGRWLIDLGCRLTGATPGGKRLAFVRA
jgi:hypothetical protein